MYPKVNNDIRLYARKKLVTNYQIAEQLHWSQSKFYRILQTEITEEVRREILSAIDSLAEDCYGE